MLMEYSRVMQEMALVGLYDCENRMIVAAPVIIITTPVPGCPAPWSVLAPAGWGTSPWPCWADSAAAGEATWRGTSAT